MRIFKRSKCLVFLLIVYVMNSLMSFLIEPVYGSSDTMWTEYYQEEEIDTIFIGSSLCSATFDPQIFNQKLGVKAFNMGTPMQALEQNITAVETALEEHKINTIVIGMGFFVLQEEPFEEAEVTFEKALARKKGGVEGFLKSLEYVSSENVFQTEKSINYWFPWIYNKEGYALDVIMRNVNTKWGVMQAGFQKDAENQVSGSRKGYRPYEGHVDYTNYSDTNSFNMYQQKLLEESLDKFERLLSLCKESDVDVLVINTPHPDFDIMSCREVYEENTKLVNEICEKYEAEYYDFSLSKQEVFEDKKEYYYDFEHLNYEGSQAFCNELCDFMLNRAKGEEMKSYFYSVEEYFKIQEESLEK